MRCRKSPYSTVSHRPYYDYEPTILDPLKSLTGARRRPTIRASGLVAHGVIAGAAEPGDQAKRRDETDVPAKRRQAEALPRLSLANGHPQRPQGAESATRQGAQAAGGVGAVEVPDGKARVGCPLLAAAAVPRRLHRPHPCRPRRSQVSASGVCGGSCAAAILTPCSRGRVRGRPCRRFGEPRRRPRRIPLGSASSWPRRCCAAPWTAIGRNGRSASRSA